jgi:hypothetical protein
MAMPEDHLAELKQAHMFLENPGFAIRASNLIGKPIEMGIAKLPEDWKEQIGAVTRVTIEKVFDTATSTLTDPTVQQPWNWSHTLASMVSGAVGGAFGWPALTVELPVSTGIILRSVADIARSQGEDFRSPEARIQCIQVLALGGTSTGDDAAEKGYFAARVAMSKAVSDATSFIAANGLSQHGAPPLVRLITQISARYSIPVSQKFAAQAIPVIGAASGALLNGLFINHFQDMAQGHFVIRRLEKIHGPEAVQSVYRELSGPPT